MTPEGKDQRLSAEFFQPGDHANTQRNGVRGGSKARPTPAGKFPVRSHGVYGRSYIPPPNDRPAKHRRTRANDAGYGLRGLAPLAFELFESLGGAAVLLVHFLRASP